MSDGLTLDKALALQKQLRRMEQEADDFLRRFLLEQAQEALSLAQEYTPREQEGLRKAWTIANGATLESVRRIGNTLVVTIENPHEDASSVEYGHLSNDGQGWVEGHFMGTLAVDEVARKLPQRFGPAFDRWVRRLSS